MRKHKQNNWLLLVGALGIVALAACSSGAAGEDAAAEFGTVTEEALIDDASSSGSNGAENSQEGTFRLDDGEIPALMQLTLGIFQLENTDMAINADLADEMLPLWKAYRSISSSDTVAQAELKAVVNQIQEVMTADQIAAISFMELTQEDMKSMIEDQGLEFGGPERSGSEDLQFPPGGRGGGVDRRGGQGNFDREAAAAISAEAGFDGEGRGGFGRAGTFLLDPLIELLEERAGQEGA